MAETVEMLDAVRRQTAASSGSKRARKQKPLEIKRPAYMSKKKPGKQIKSGSEFVSFFRGLGGN